MLIPFGYIEHGATINHRSAPYRREYQQAICLSKALVLISNSAVVRESHGNQNKVGYIPFSSAGSPFMQKGIAVFVYQVGINSRLSKIIEEVSANLPACSWGPADP